MKCNKDKYFLFEFAMMLLKYVNNFVMQLGLTKFIIKLIVPFLLKSSTIIVL